MTSPKKNDTAFLDIAREGRRGDTKRRWRPGDIDLARSRYKRRALIGHNRRSVLRPAAKSAKDVTKKERGMERVSDSDLATNCGMEDRQATPATKVTMEDRACSSPTLLAVARANKKQGRQRESAEGSLRQRLKGRRDKICQHHRQVPSRGTQHTHR